MPARVAAGLRVRIALEVGLYVAGVAALARWALPSDHGGGAWLAAVALAVPVLVSHAHGDGWRDGGVRLDGFLVALRHAAPWFLALSLAIVLVGLAVDGFHGAPTRRLVRMTSRYLVWGPVQQYLLRRLLQAGLAPRAAVALAAGLFALVHAPNPLLMAVSGVLALCTARLFLRVPNVLALGLVHGALAVLLYYAWPIDWHQQLTLGGEYLARVGGAR